MMRLLLAAPIPALLMLAPHIHAATQWVKVASASGSASYIDRRSILGSDGSGAGIRAVSLVSFNDIQTTPDGTRYRSMTAQHLYSCGQRSTTLLAQTYYPEPMGRGPVGQSFKYEKFAPEVIAGGSAAEGALKILCKRPPVKG